MVRAKVGFEAEIPVKTLFVYSDDVDIEKLLRDTGAQLLWVELEHENYDKILKLVNSGAIDLPPRNIYIVCRDIPCVKQYLNKKVNIVLDIDFGLDVLPNVIRLKSDNIVKAVIYQNKVFKPRNELYIFDKVVVE